MKNIDLDDKDIERIFHDYRETILNLNPNNRNIEYEKAYVNLRNSWNSASNSLEQSLIYELSPLCKHVENYSIVRKDAYQYYESDNMNGSLLDQYAHADIMNGWWYCFKFMFGLVDRKKKSGIEEIKNIIKEKENKDVPKVLLKYAREKGIKTYDEEAYKWLICFMRLAYTVGNITPAPINPSADPLDSWEYKLNQYQHMYHDYRGDIKNLYFLDYVDNEQIIKQNTILDDFKNNPGEYIQSRVELIIRRGYRILKNNKEKVIEDDIEEQLLDRLIKDYLIM